MAIKKLQNQIKRAIPFALFLAVFLGSIWIVVVGQDPALPSRHTQLLLYSNQKKDDLRALFARAIKEAKSSVHISIYAMTDPYLLALLQQQADRGVNTLIFYDPSATSSSSIPANCTAFPIRLPGSLMHRKILITDEEKVFIGSANFTPSSLKIHDNLVVGIFHPGLARFISQAESPYFPFDLKETRGELWLLPCADALERVLTLLRSAKRAISIAMFTLTHPVLIQALIEAKRRHVDVQVAIDHYTAEGASLKALEALRKEKIPVHLSFGGQLFHHKWALIDHTCLILGSANWTRAAFNRNQDCLMILHDLPSNEQKQIQKIWKIIDMESIEKIIGN